MEISLVEHASFLSERETHACLPIFPTLACRSQRGRQKKGPQLWEKSRGQVQQGLRRLKVCLSARGERQTLLFWPCSLSFDTMMCVIATETCWARVLFPHFLLGHV